MLVLDVEPTRCRLTEEYLKKAQLDSVAVSSVTAAFDQLRSGDFDIFYCDLASISHFTTFHKDFPDVSLVLLLTEEIEQHYSELLNYSYVHFIVSCAGFDEGTCYRAFAVSSKKIRSKKYFGYHLYFDGQEVVSTAKVQDSRQRHDLKDQMMSAIKNLGVRASVADRMYTVAEELLMNAIYDAPVGADGQAIYNHMSRKEEVKLDSAHQSNFTFIVGEKLAGVSVEDPFGALPTDLIVKYLKSCYEGKAGSLNAQKGGAGRGLHQIIENSDVTIFNVSPQCKTEVIYLFSLEKAGALPPPTFHYYRN